MPFDEAREPNRYLKLDDGDKRAMFISSRGDRIKAIIGTKRLKGLPSQERNGQIAPVNLLPGHGLIEPSHFVIFEDNILGIEYNKNGPRSGAIKSYLLKKCEDLIDDVEINEVWHPDVLKLLRRADGIMTVNLKVAMNRIGSDDVPHGSLMSALNGFREVEPDYVQIILGMNQTRTSKKNPNQIKRALKITKGEIAKIMGNREIVDGVKSFKITPFNGAEFDLVSPYLVYDTQVTKQDPVHRTVDSNSMFTNIEIAYKNLKPLIDESRKASS